MSTELCDRLIEALHNADRHIGASRYCSVCHTRVSERLMPIIRDWIWNGTDNHDLD